ncbi:hypothetical protein SprV_0100137200 [Sparganum proliferum]
MPFLVEPASNTMNDGSYSANTDTFVELDAQDDNTELSVVVVSRSFADGSEKAIMHASRRLTPAEKNYGQIENGALALVFAVKKFYKLLYGRHFTLLTDQKPLLSIFGSKKGILVYTASRLQRWATVLLGYDFDIRYCRTTDFGQAAALSRLVSNQQEPEEDTVIAAISIEDDVRRQLSDAIRGKPVSQRIDATVFSGSPSSGRTFYVCDKVNRRRSLVNTGAQIGVVPPTPVDRRCPSPGLHLQAANCCPISTFGSRFLTLNIGLRRSFSWLFVIADVPHAIVGSDFLAEFDLLVHCRRSCLLDRTTGLSVRGLTPFNDSCNLSLLDTGIACPYRDLLLQHPNIIKPQFRSLVFSVTLIDAYRV